MHLLSAPPLELFGQVAADMDPIHRRYALNPPKAGNSKPRLMSMNSIANPAQLLRKDPGWRTL